MNKLTKILAAGVLAVGLAVATSVPAEAVSLYRYCNWPQKSSVVASVKTMRSTSVTVRAYSPGGTLLGTRYGRTAVSWESPWEDIRWVVTNYDYVQTWCR